LATAIERAWFASGCYWARGQKARQGKERMPSAFHRAA